MKKITFLLLFLYFANCTAQQHREPDTLAKYSDKELLQKASDATHYYKDKERQIYYNHLFDRTITEALRSEAYYTIAFDYYNFTDATIDYCISMLQKSLELEIKNKNYYNQIVCYDGLGLFYGAKNDTKKVLEVLQKMKAIIDSKTTSRYEYLKIESSPYRIYSQIGDFERARAGYHQSNKDIREYLKESEMLPASEVEGLTYDMKTNYKRLITTFNMQKELDSAAFYIKKVKDLEAKGFTHSAGIWHEEATYLILKGKYDEVIAKIEGSKDLYNMNSKGEQCKALHCLALCYQYKKDYAKVLALCEKGLQIKARPFSFLNYELEFLKMAASSSQQLGNIEKANGYGVKYLDILQSIDYQRKAKFIGELYNQDVIAPLGEKLQAEKRFSSYYLLGAISLLLLFSCFLAWLIGKSRKDREKFLGIIADLEQKEIEALEEEEEASAPDPISPLEEIPLFEEPKNLSPLAKTLNENRAAKILKQLDAFEKKQLFLSPNITSGSLAADFNTNVVYLSAVLKKYKNSNFNDYINLLRIDYIISKLKSNPEYSSYKIAYLAAECGFSSHAAFIRVFTKLKGIPPSKFISLLSKYN